MATNEANNTDLARAEILWKSADALRGQIDAAEYKHVVLGLLFLKYISDSFETRRDELKAELQADGIRDPQLESLLENRDEYTAERVFWVPPKSRWANLQNQAARPDIATLIDDAILAVERDNPNLKGKLPRDYARRGIEANLGSQPADSFLRNLHPDLKADYILANPPFNISDWSGKLLADDVRWRYGTPPTGNANYAWIQHFIHHLAPPNGHGGGVAGFVMVNGSLSTGSGGEDDIRQRIVEADLVDAIVCAACPALPHHRHPRLPLVPDSRQDRQEPQTRRPRPQRGDALHRRPQAWHAADPHPARAHRGRRRGKHAGRWHGRPEL